VTSPPDDNASPGYDPFGNRPPPPVTPVPVVPLTADEQSSSASPADLPRFCRSCGSPWDPMWAECPCAARKLLSQPAMPFEEQATRPVASALALYFTLLGTILVGAVLIKALGTEGATAVNIEIAIGIIDAFIVVVWCAARRRDTPRLLRTVGAPRWYLLAVAAVPATFLLAAGVVALVNRVFDVPIIEMVQPMLDAGYGWTVIVLATCVQPAVFEELAFRGVILSGLRQTMSDGEAIIVSALMFMIIHLAFLSFPHLVLMGLVTGYLRVRSGSLYPGMILHFAHNLTVVMTESWLRGG
jgi:uncharacterized protein